MHEGDSPPSRPGPRHLVYQAISGCPAGLECSVEVGHLIADVVNAGAPPGQEFSNWTVGVERGKQLHLRVAQGQCQDGGAINGFGRMRHDAQDVTVEGECRVQVGDSDSDVRDAGEIGHWCLAGKRVSGKRGSNSGPSSQLKIIQRRIINMGAANTLTVHVSDASFAAEIEQANGLVLVDFWASWCGPCQVVAPILDQLAGEYVGKAKVTKVDVDANQRTAMRFNVRSIPSILFFKNGQHVDTVIGAVPKATLEGKIKQHLS